MTTVSEAIRSAHGKGNPPGNTAVTEHNGRGVPASPRARVAAEPGDRNTSGVLARLLAAVWADLCEAWVWRARPPTLRDLWSLRWPPLTRVPGQSRVLRTGWALWNHVVLAPFAVVAVALWLLMHPARALLAGLVVGPIVAMWING